MAAMVFNAKDVETKLRDLTDRELLDYYAWQLPSGEWRFRINPIENRPDRYFFTKMVNLTANQAGLFLVGFCAGMLTEEARNNDNAK